MEKISILTPLHDMPPEFVRRALQSVQSQHTDRYETEWLIAVHNMDESYYHTICDLTEDCESTRVFKLNEPSRCLGAVRNALLDKADGDYIFWLDGDDEFIPGFTATAADELARTGADMAVFPCSVSGADNVFGDRFFYEAELPCKTTEVFERGDIRISEALEGLFINVWSWGFRGDFVRECGAKFDQEPGAAFCDGNYTFDAVSCARRICVMPETKGYVYYIRGDSDFKSKAREPRTYWTALRRFMDDLIARRSDTFPDINGWMWTQLSQSLMILLDRSGTVNELRTEIAAYITSILPEMQVIRSDHRFEAGTGISPADVVLTFFPEMAAACAKPHWKHREVKLSGDGLLTQNADIDLVWERVRSAASEYSALRILPNPRNCFRGIVREGAMPDVRRIDLTGSAENSIQKTVSGYRNLEELRGFGPDEVRCRITLFDAGKDSRILLSWDSRFLSDTAVNWLINLIIH